MPSTVTDLFSAAELDPHGVVRWGERAPLPSPGVYVVALTHAPDSMSGALAKCPISEGAIRDILHVRPELKVDGSRPSPEELAERISSFWLPDEIVLYVGRAGTSVASRLHQYYRTRLGAARPHAGGYFLKFLTVLPGLQVHYAATADPARAEDTMLSDFCANVSEQSREALADPAHPFPFANLEWPPGTRKRHGLTGARGELAGEAGAAQVSRSPLEPIVPSDQPRLTGGPPSRAATGLRSQRVTSADLRAGRIRIPRGATKAALPQEPGRGD